MASIVLAGCYYCRWEKAIEKWLRTPLSELLFQTNGWLVWLLQLYGPGSFHQMLVVRLMVLRLGATHEHVILINQGIPFIWD